MESRLDHLLLAFILLAVPVVLAIDRFIEVSAATQFVIGLLIGLTIVAGIVYTYRVSSQTTQKR
jgi:hypothetical protein